MADVDRLFEQFIERQLAGAKPDPMEYMSQASGKERDELGDLIEVFLEQAPREAWDEEAFRGSTAEQIVDQIDRSLHGVSGRWPALLPRLRHRAKLMRSELTTQLAERLGVSDKEEKVRSYYHGMEQGELPADGVSDKVLEALGKLVGVSTATLRQAGERLTQDLGAPPGTQAAPGVFARKGVPDPDYMPARVDASRESPAEDEDDEVDRLFRGG
jgi:hypothetical protein